MDFKWFFQFKLFQQNCFIDKYLGMSSELLDGNNSQSQKSNELLSQIKNEVKRFESLKVRWSEIVDIVNCLVLSIFDNSYSFLWFKSF